MRLAIERWRVRETADADGEYVHVQGRTAGVGGAVLRWLGSGATTSLSIDDKRVRVARRSPVGTSLRVTPITCVASVSCGSCRPWKQSLMLAAGGLIAIAAPGAAWIGGSLLLLLAPLSYLATNRLFLELVDSGGRSVRIEFDRAARQDLQVDESASARIVSIVEMLRFQLTAPRRTVDDRLPFEPSARAGAAKTLPSDPPTTAASRLMGLFKGGRTNGPADHGGAAQSIDPADAAVVDAAEHPADCPPVRIRLACLSCGAVVQPNDAYCGNCGDKLPFLPL